MASVENLADKPPGPRLDKPEPEAAQGARGKASVWRPSLRVRTLVTQRWLIILGELGALALMALALDVRTPYPVCLGVIGLAAWINVLTGVASPGTRLYGAREATAQLAFDILQISVLVFLTGGAANPFILMLIAPVTLAAATLPWKPVLVLGALAIAATLFLAIVALPSLTVSGLGVSPSLNYRMTAAAANVAGIALIAGYVPSGGGGIGPHGAGPRRHPGGAGPRAAALGLGRPRRRRRPRARHAARHHLHRR